MDKPKISTPLVRTNATGADAAQTTYDRTLHQYSRLLNDNPGHALFIGGDSVALLAGGALVAAHLHAAVEDYVIGSPFDFDPVGWDEENECWESDDSAGVTQNCIVHPRFISIAGSEITPKKEASPCK